MFFVLALLCFMGLAQAGRSRLLLAPFVLALSGCWAAGMSPTESLQHDDRELSLERREEPLGQVVELQTTTTDKGMSVTVERVETCRHYDLAQIERITTVQRSYNRAQQDSIRALKLRGTLGAIGGTLLSTGFYFLAEPSPSRDYSVASGAVSGATGIWMLVNAAMIDRKGRSTVMEPQTIEDERNSEETRCDSTPIKNAALSVSDVELGTTNDYGVWLFTPGSMPDASLSAILSKNPMSIGEQDSASLGEAMTSAARSECEQRAAPAQKAAQQRYDGLMRRYRSASLMCLDGKASPSCTCGEERDGCCANNLGIRGCSTPKPVLDKIALCGR